MMEWVARGLTLCLEGTWDAWALVESGLLRLTRRPRTWLFRVITALLLSVNAYLVLAYLTQGSIIEPLLCLGWFVVLWYDLSVGGFGSDYASLMVFMATALFIINGAHFLQQRTPVSTFHVLRDALLAVHFISDTYLDDEPPNKDDPR